MRDNREKKIKELFIEEGRRDYDPNKILAYICTFTSYIIRYINGERFKYNI